LDPAESAEDPVETCGLNTFYSKTLLLW